MSSLIFVVILAVWAVYLVQHWVRRRDHLATARSVDRFSEAMRVLERRRALPRPDVAEPAPASAPVQLLRPARPEVVVKRGAPAPVHGSTAAAPSAAYRRAKLAAQLRAGGLLVSSVVMVVLAALVAFQLVHWAWAFAGIALLAATVGGVRLSVARRRRPVRRSSPRSSSRSGSPTRVAASTSTTSSAQDSTLAAQATAVALPRTARRAVDLEPRRPAAVLYDIAEVEAQATEAPHTPAVEQAPVARAPVEPVLGGAWDPVPVPPPTYTLKARAYRTPAELPADGVDMALEEEFEELPRVPRVG